MKLDKLKKENIKVIKHNFNLLTASGINGTNVVKMINDIENKRYNIVGYGSLLNKTDAQRTFSNIKSFTPGRLHGWERIFNLKSDYAYLNVRKNPNISIDVSVINISAEGMIKFIMRELYYNIIDVKLEDGKKAKMVVSPLVSSKTVPSLCYVGLCIEGMKSIGSVDKFLDESKTNFGTLREWLTELDIVSYMKHRTHLSR